MEGCLQAEFFMPAACLACGDAHTILLLASKCTLPCSPAVIVVPIVLALLNLYWFTKIVKGAMKVLFGGKKKTKTA